MLGVLSRFSYDAGLGPLQFVAWRAGFGSLVIAVVVAARARRGTAVLDPRRMPRHDLLALIGVAVAACVLNIATFFAFDLTTVAIVLLAFYTYPAFVAIVAVALGHERLDTLGWTALVLALGGMVLVVAGGMLPAGIGEAAAPRIHPLGVALGLVGAACQTVFVTLARGRFRMM